MAIDTVYIAMCYSIDWSGPPPTFGGVGKTVREALSMAISNPKLVEEWIQEKDMEVRAYFGVIAYDMTTSPPTRLDRADLQRGGGPVRDA